jgi:hypothetical protein
MDWWQMKYWVEETTGLNMDALHVHAGVLAQLLVALVLRRSIASLWPWLIVLAAAIANEWWDLTYEVWPTRDDQWDESIRDTWNTMLLPTILLLLSRFAPGLLVRNRAPDKEEKGADSGQAR